MGFASTYLKERALFPEIIKEAPDKQTGIIIVVPAYNEPGICKLLDSLALCSEPECNAEVIIVVNAPLDAVEESIENNKTTIKNIESWKKENSNCFFRLFAFIADQQAISDWGVGLARKTGMDEAVRRFNCLDNPGGIILNLDADCQVEKNYFVSVCDELLNKKDRTACSIYFEHPLAGNDFPENIYNYITLYELHLRYYFQGLAYSGFPYVFHTVGSAIAVKALQYVKAGGMNRRQAGEDFYFIQKLVPAGGYFNLNSTTVYPSPRTSSRVPFGTGASIGKLTEENSPTLFTYNMLAFKELRYFFGMTEKFYHFTPEELPECYKSFPTGLKYFIDEIEWIGKMMEIKNNTSGLASFRKRFFGWFNMFRIVKYLNLVHIEIFEKKPVDVSASELLENTGIDFISKEPLNLLLYYRELEKTS
ncbi:MAG: glycosyltransferase family 2 protein [Bacteroidales bacterium]|nr:glycosyltransferase family 2 protein [Bacteroidales bacterium]MDP3003452.1 glycosyltransferase family 2 protein [Bacteroidales bacterium]